MSKTLIQNKDFIRFILNTDTSSKRQKKAIFETITKDQVLAIVEICYNLLNIKVSDKIKTVINKRRKLLLKIVNKKVYRILLLKKLLIKHYKQIIETLLFIKDQLLELIS